jgi:Protein of unknown function (DUF1566)
MSLPICGSSKPAVAVAAHTSLPLSAHASNIAEATGAANGGTCGDAGQCDAEKFAQLTNLVGLCGHNYWRLPHVKDLESVAHVGATNPAIEGYWFPNTTPSCLWSGSPNSADATNAWGVNLSDGSAVDSLRSPANKVRLVRAGQ